MGQTMRQMVMSELRPLTADEAAALVEARIVAGFAVARMLAQHLYKDWLRVEALGGGDYGWRLTETGRRALANGERFLP